ncbi:conserved hypothetical protein [Xenorhabdus nematophila F1]|uniref:Uncharacterized protein n=1 Tax=Xenorhabdus nematophila (strain ATCC 19061 / DSM 3370 / CCUG 14189 / LMG 1036 / NCIMB 9965 / AN6) TaxID=406817 RepID=D3VFK4_XENNA|nr:hypothetical protein XNC1_2259 [Xenorhabdus nematophila ATCC 19061]CCW32328.1 conserved hypothetical protein [Xenorhabdus nematophila F1]CEE89915.1 hypothetical protein XNA1_1000005 [Xenorhabdus nematophila str. Anatoliense]CEF30315.1 hypothetical protein XNW1_2410024 [Xenorhabdus nematophila str. Websteri]CEK23175.1 hypothetical protein XNC2_2181 [Xenorhabdus nematophila AN6/1]
MSYFVCRTNQYCFKQIQKQDLLLIKGYSFYVYYTIVPHISSDSSFGYCPDTNQFLGCQCGTH